MTACNDINDENTCNTVNECYWQLQSQRCACASLAPLDIIFGIDKSASIGQSGNILYIYIYICT